MSARTQGYRYVGPPEILVAARVGKQGKAIRSLAEFERWIESRAPDERQEPFTFVVDLERVLRLAARRSEHVACAGGDRVLSAGEVTFGRVRGRWSVVEISNQSTGYCPDASSWWAVAEALDQSGLDHPDGFTHTITFRRCLHCQELNVVRESDFVCVFCGSDLPDGWNVDPLAVVDE